MKVFGSQVKVQIHGLPSELGPPEVLLLSEESTVGDVLHFVQEKRGPTTWFSFTLSDRRLDGEVVNRKLKELREVVNNVLDISLFLVVPVASHCRSDNFGSDSEESDDGRCACLSLVSDDNFLLWNIVNSLLPLACKVDTIQDELGRLRLVSNGRKHLHGKVIAEHLKGKEHLWVGLNKVLCVSHDYGKATFACFKIVENGDPQLCVDRGKRFVSVCAVPSLVQAFGRPLTLQELKEEGLSYDNQERKRFVIAFRRRPRSPPTLYDDVVVGDVMIGEEYEWLEGPTKKVALCSERYFNNPVTLGPDEDEKALKEAKEELASIVEQKNVSVGIVVWHAHRLAEGTLVAYCPDTGLITEDYLSLESDHDVVEFRMIGSLEKVGLLLNPHSIEDDLVGDGVLVVLLLTGVVPGIHIEGDIVPGAGVFAFAGDDGNIMVEAVADQSMGIGTGFVGRVASVDSDKTVTLQLVSRSWTSMLNK
jgi:hypothetical protein